MNALLADCRHALRLYVRTPAASLIAVAVLAIGLAFVASFVSLYVDLVLRPHPGFEPGARVVSYGREDNGYLPLSLIERIAEESSVLEAAAGIDSRVFLIGPERDTARGEMVSREFFAGVRPKLALGRGFLSSEHDAEGEPVIVISARFWQGQLGGRSDVLGETIEIRGQGLFGAGALDADDDADGPIDFRIVGVMAPEFTGILPPQRESYADFWIPVEQGVPAQLRSLPAQLAQSGSTSDWQMRGIGRRQSGVSAGAVARDLNARYRQDLEALTSGPGMRFGVLDGLVFDHDLQRDTQRQLQIFLGASVLLALVAAANVSLFLLARAPGRRRELGIRLAVGAPLARLARQLASEAALLVLLAVPIGLTISVWLANFLRGLEFLRQAEWRDVRLLDWRVLAIVLAFLAVLALLVSLAPMLGVKRAGIAASSRQISARATLAQRIAGTLQIAVAGTLGGAAVAFAWYLGALIWGYPGYETRDLHVASFTIDTGRYFDEAPADARFERYFIDQSRRNEAIAALPGVSGVSLTSAVPGVRAVRYSGYYPDPNDPAEQIYVPMVVIDSDYVDLLGLRLLYGRAPRANEPRAILVNRALALQMWGRDNVVGEVLGGGGPRSSEVVGVVADVSYGHPRAAPEPMGFATSPQQFLPSGFALVRSGLSSAELRRQLQGLVDTGALELTLTDVTPLAARRLEALAADRARGLLTIATASLVVLLAAFGFYGTQRYLVAAGRREYAIRASLGAGPSALGRLVVRRGLELAWPGLVTGALLAFIVVGWLRGDFVSSEVSPPLVTAGVVAGLLTMLVGGSLAPAKEARTLQPAVLLREE